MPWAEKRKDGWRARWRDPDGAKQSQPGFRTRKEAAAYARDREADIRAGRYVDPRAGRITLTEWVNLWFPAQDLELNTLSTYKYAIEVLILPEFGDQALADLEAHQIAAWERKLVSRGYQRGTARDARSTLSTILGDAMPRYIQSNPAVRKRGRGRKGQRRIQQAEKAARVWATPLEVLLLAERCAALSGEDTDFVMLVTIGYTGMRWSEAVGLRPDRLHGDTIDINRKLYELDSRFYTGAPKDGSIRTADLPLFLAALLGEFLAGHPARACTCRGTKQPWCAGEKHVFLGPGGGHFRRSNYSSRIVRPAADGWYAERGGQRPRPAMPVLADMSGLWPGRPLPPWPPAVPGEPYLPPAGRGVTRLTGKPGAGRCPCCGRSTLLRRDGTLIRHPPGDDPCPGTGAPPADPLPLASWLPLRAGLTPHGLRHGHETWLEDIGVRYVLQSERMGHEVPGMRGVYSHITAGMRAALRGGLQELWEQSLTERAALAPRSAVAVLDHLLARLGGDRPESAPNLPPAIEHSGHSRREVNENDREPGL